MTVVDGERHGHDAVVIATGLTPSSFARAPAQARRPRRPRRPPGPVLERSLLARQVSQTLPIYEPRRHALQILDLGGGTALATRGRWWAEGPLLRRLKLTIDRRWLARYR